MESLLFTMDPQEATEFEQSLPPGTYMVVMETPEPLSESQLQEIRLELDSRGIIGNVTQTYTSPNQVQISYVRSAEGIGLAWLAVIPLIVPLAIIGATIFGILKIEDIKNAILPVILVAGGIAIALAWLLREPLGAAAKRYL